MATTSFAPVTMPGRKCLKGRETWSGSSSLCGRTTALTIQRKSNQQRTQRKLAICAKYNDHSHGGVDFIAGFLLGGALCGTIAYAFAPQMRKHLYNEYEDGYHRPKKMNYYGYESYYDDEVGGLEKTKQTLNTKIKQLSSAIDNVSSRLRGGKKAPAGTDAEEATM